jgi:hypothetical protein
MPDCTCHTILNGVIVAGDRSREPGCTGFLLTADCPRHAYLAAMRVPRGTKPLTMTLRANGTGEISEGE